MAYTLQGCAETQNKFEHSIRLLTILGVRIFDSNKLTSLPKIILIIWCTQTRTRENSCIPSVCKNSLSDVSFGSSIIINVDSYQHSLFAGRVSTSSKQANICIAATIFT